MVILELLGTALLVALAVIFVIMVPCAVVSLAVVGIAEVLCWLLGSKRPAVGSAIENGEV
jgi:hypothetical protein